MCWGDQHLLKGESASSPVSPKLMRGRPQLNSARRSSRLGLCLPLGLGLQLGAVQPDLATATGALGAGYAGELMRKELQDSLGQGAGWAARRVHPRGSHLEVVPGAQRRPVSCCWHSWAAALQLSLLMLLSLETKKKMSTTDAFFHLGSGAIDHKPVQGVLSWLSVHPRGSHLEVVPGAQRRPVSCCWHSWAAALQLSLLMLLSLETKKKMSTTDAFFHLGSGAIDHKPVQGVLSWLSVTTTANATEASMDSSYDLSVPVTDEGGQWPPYAARAIPAQACASWWCLTQPPSVQPKGRAQRECLHPISLSMRTSLCMNLHHTWACVGSLAKGLAV